MGLLKPHPQHTRDGPGQAKSLKGPAIPVPNPRPHWPRPGLGPKEKKKKLIFFSHCHWAPGVNHFVGFLRVRRGQVHEGPIDSPTKRPI